MAKQFFNNSQLRESRLTTFRLSTSGVYPNTYKIGYDEAGSAILGNFNVAQFKQERQYVASHKLQSHDRATIDVRVGDTIHAVSMLDVFKGKASPELIVELCGGDTRRRSDGNKPSDLECMTAASAEVIARFEKRIAILEERQQQQLELINLFETDNMKVVEKYTEELKSLRLAIKHPLYAFSPYWRERFSAMRLILSFDPDRFTVPRREPQPTPFRLPEQGNVVKLSHEETNAKRARTSC